MWSAHQEFAVVPFKKSIGRCSRRHGFSLVELSIVFGIIASIIAGIWAYSVQVQRNASVTQSIQAINSIVDGVRIDYANLASISGGAARVVPFIVPMGAIPTSLLKPSATTCGGVISIFADTPFSNNTSHGSPCGTLLVCSWQMGVQPGNSCIKGKGSTIGQQTFAIQFDYLDTPSCIALATQITSTNPTTGLKDIYIDGVSATAGTGVLPVTIATVTTLCQTPIYVDFVYSLRAPTT